jgi:Nucleotidyltransferase domain
MDDRQRRDASPELDLPGIPRELLRCVLEKSLELEPDAQAVLVRGSYATQTAHENSDLDLTAVVPGPAETPYRAWFEDAPEGRLLPISMSTKSLESWLQKRETPAEWALGFPAVDAADYLWSTDAGRQRLDENPSAHRPPGNPSLEDFVNTTVKARAAAALDDGAGVRLYARETALLAPALLRKLNPEVVVRNHREAVLTARDLSVAPEHYKDDFTTAVGLRPAEDARVNQAIQRLALELLAFLRERDPNVDPQPEMSHFLTNGTLERYVGSGA